MRQLKKARDVVGIYQFVGLDAHEKISYSRTITVTGCR